MPFEIEEIKNTIKKNPVPWVIGLTAAVGAGAYVLAKRSGESGYIAEVYPETPIMPQDVAAGPASPGDISDAMLQQLLEELAGQQHESLGELAQMNREFMEGLAKTLESYVQQTLPRQVQQPLPQEPVITQDMARKVETIASTPSITFHPQGTRYTPQQIDVMHQWSVEEQTAISRGYAGTSKTPSGLASSGMTMTFYPTGHVAFVPKGQEAPPTPRSYADTPLGRALSEARSRSEKVISITGSKKAAESALKRIYGTGGHVSYFGSEEAYGKTIVEKVKSGEKFSDPKAAKVYVTFHPELGITPEQIK